MDRVFNQMYKVIPRRNIVFREAIGWDDEAGAPVYDVDRTILANILDKPRYEDTLHNAFVVLDGVFLTVWFRDWFDQDDDEVTDANLLAIEVSAKGAMSEEDGRNYSRFCVDGQWLQYKTHAFSMRPDGKLYAVKFTLQAA